MSYQGKLAALWAALMLCYLLGDVLRLMDLGQGAGSIDGKPMSQRTALLSAAILRWVSAAAAVVLFLLNVFGIHTYSGLYDRMLIGVSLILNLLTAWVSWRG